MNAMLPYPDNFYVALPWVNNTSGNIQNEMVWDAEDREFQWAFEGNFQLQSVKLSFQPYLLHILHQICRALGYEGDFAAIENSNFKFLLICNTLPAPWDAHNFALALPHWTLTEFFEEMENFLFGNFTINHKMKTIAFQFADGLASEAGEVLLDKVVDSYTTQVTQEDKSEYLGSVNVKYEDNGSLLWAYHACDRYVRKHKHEAKVFDTLEELVKAAEKLKESGVYSQKIGAQATRTQYFRGYDYHSDGHKLLYARDVNRYFVMYCYKSIFVTNGINGDNSKWYRYYNRLLPINAFGGGFSDEDAKDMELKVVPAWIESTGDEHGNMLFLNCGEMGSKDSWTVSSDGSSSADGSSNSAIDYDAGDLAQGAASLCISKGENKNTDAYFDQIYMGFWDGNQYQGAFMPHPWVDSLEITDDFKVFKCPYSLRLKDGMWDKKRKVLQQIDSKQQYEFSFLEKKIPNPRALFFIRGGKYICEKITATFKENGMSQLLKGTFYRVIEN